MPNSVSLLPFVFQMRPFVVLLFVTLITAVPFNIQPHSRTLEVIQDIISRSSQTKALDAVQVFTKGDYSMDLSLLFDYLNMNYPYQIASESHITEDHGYILTLLFVNDSMSLKFLTSSLHKTFDTITRYFIIAYSNCDLTEINDIFEEFWKLQIADVILVCPRLETTELYTFYPYAKDHCNKVEPVLVSSKEDYFPPKNFNFHGCSLRAAVYIEAPHFIDGPTKGIDAELIKFLSGSLNFTVLFEDLNVSDAREIHDPKSNYFKKVYIRS